MLLRDRWRCAVLSLFVLMWATQATSASASDQKSKTIARCGQGWLEDIDGTLVLHLKGTPYEMGYQHGALLREKSLANFQSLKSVMDNKHSISLGPITIRPSDAVQYIQRIQQPYVPAKYGEEIEGLAAGSGLSVADARFANFLPELFHCSGFAIMNSATKDGTLYHGRVLDYAVDWGLQDHAVIVVSEPDGEIPFVNITYAGFIGCVTGMNAKSISIGEMGGFGLGHWQGVPMAFLVREALTRAETLEQAIDVFRTSPRTCEYFYVVADGKTNEAVGMEASWNVMEIIYPGVANPRLPIPVTDCALLSAGDRYQELVRRVQADHGSFTPEKAIRLMDRGVAMESNLHNVLFEPKSTRFWVSHASSDGTPAADQPYAAFQLTELLQRQPDPQSPSIPLVTEAKLDR